MIPGYDIVLTGVVLTANINRSTQAMPLQWHEIPTVLPTMVVYHFYGIFVSQKQLHIVVYGLLIIIIIIIIILFIFVIFILVVVWCFHVFFRLDGCIDRIGITVPFLHDPVHVAFGGTPNDHAHHQKGKGCRHDATSRQYGQSGALVQTKAFLQALQGRREQVATVGALDGCRSALCCTTPHVGRYLLDGCGILALHGIVKAFAINGRNGIFAEVVVKEVLLDVAVHKGVGFGRCQESFLGGW